MSQQKHRYYSGRQIISMPLVQPEEYTDRVILCIPAFAWRVARAFLSRQAQWRSTYADSFFDSYYLSPSDEDMDTIKASIDAALAEDDMSCDLENAINDLATDLVSEMSDNSADLVNAVMQLVAKECGAGCGGSSGAGASEAPANPYVDDGETPPDGFATYTEFDAYKCGLAKLIYDQIEADLDYIKDMAITEFTSIVLAGLLLTPIPLDDLGGLAGLLVAWSIEQTLDGFLTEILTEWGLDEESIVCGIYNAISATDANAWVNDWAASNLSVSADVLLAFFVNNDNMNRLFEEVNQILPSYDCQSCPTDCDTAYLLYGTGVVGDGTCTADSELLSGFREAINIAFDRDENAGNAICGSGVRLTAINIDYGELRSYRIWDDNDDIVYNSSSPPPLPWDNVTKCYVFDGDTGADPVGVTFTWERV